LNTNKAAAAIVTVYCGSDCPSVCVDLASCYDDLCGLWVLRVGQMISELWTYFIQYLEWMIIYISSICIAYKI